MSRLRFALAVVAALPLVACSSSSNDASGAGGAGGTGGDDAGAAGAAGDAGAAGAGDDGGEASTECGPDVAPPNEVLPDEADPTGGVFTLDEALAELPDGPGPLRAILATDQGELTCELRPDKAPNGVANFVGLARGRRPWFDAESGSWVKRPFYDGLLFHRVIPGFVAQGGDPEGTGYGGPGYQFDDEISDLTHVPGTLAYANSGANTNGSQFYVAETTLPSLDGGYTIFGLCTPVSVVTALTSVETDAKDKPLVDEHLQHVTITRCAP